MKKTFIIVCYILIASNLHAQKTKILEPAILECHYRYQALKDTVNGVPFNEDLIILRTGKNISQVFSYHLFYGDSLLSTPSGSKLAGQLTMEGIRKQDYASIPGIKIIREYLYKNYPSGKITTVSYVNGLNDVIFEEENETQIWTIQDSFKNILDYRCQLANCKFRGREYYAWFTTEIPINEGPWKFNGLPGLIMEVYDKNRHYHFEIVNIKTDNLQPVTFYNLLKRKPARTTRKKYLSTLKKYTENSVQAMKASSGIDLNPDNKPIENRTAYDLMERDY